MVLGTATILIPNSLSWCATPSVSSPPIAMIASNFASLTFLTTSWGPFSFLKGFVLDDPRIDPPCGRMLLTSFKPSGM